MLIEWIPNFNAGVLSPLGDARTQLDKYTAGCRVLQNFIPIPFGGASKRPGLLYCAETIDSTRATRAEAFRFSPSQQFVMLFSHQTVSFLKDRALILSGGSPYVVATPYQEADLFALQFKQINDVVFITHPDYEPKRLVRYGDTNWQLEAMPWDWPPMRDENIDETITITPSSSSGLGITLTASKPLFQRGQVGGYFQLAFANPDASRTSEVRTSSTSTVTLLGSWIDVVGTWNSYSFAYWQGLFEIHRSYDGGTTFEVIRSFRGVQGDRNFTTSGQESQPCKLRLRFNGSRFDYGGANNYDVHAIIEVIDPRLYGYVQITEVLTDGATTAKCNTVGALPAVTATSLWAEGAFSTYRGWPRTCALHEGRVWFGGNQSETLRLWASVSQDFYNFRRTTLSDGSIAATISHEEQISIQWLSAGSDVLIVGTESAEFAVSGNNAPLAPNNLSVKIQSADGSAYMQPIRVNYVILFCDRSLLRIREFVFSLQVNGFISADVTRLANHILRPGLKQWTFQQSYDGIVWAVTTDGQLAGLTYEREENVVGWHNHVTDGFVESVCCLFGEQGQSDQIFAVVRRTIDGHSKRYVELLAPDVQEKQRTGNAAEAVFLDCSKVYSFGSPTTAVTGLSHLEGKTVDVLADGAKRSSKVVVAGAITLDDTASKVVVGLSYEAVLKPMKGEVPRRDGTAQTRHFKLSKLAARLFMSMGGDMRADDGKPWQALNYRDTASPMGVALPLFTGEKLITLDSSSETSLEFAIRSNDPYPFTVVALAPRFEVSDN